MSSATLNVPGVARPELREVDLLTAIAAVEAAHERAKNVCPANIRLSAAFKWHLKKLGLRLKSPFAN